MGQPVAVVSWWLFAGDVGHPRFDRFCGSGQYIRYRDGSMDALAIDALAAAVRPALSGAPRLLCVEGALVAGAHRVAGGPIDAGSDSKQRLNRPSQGGVMGGERSCQALKSPGWGSGEREAITCLGEGGGTPGVGMIAV